MVYKCIKDFECDGLFLFTSGIEYKLEYDKDNNYYLYNDKKKNGQKSFNLILYELEIHKYFSIFEIRQRKINQLIYGT